MTHSCQYVKKASLAHSCPTAKSPPTPQKKIPCDVGAGLDKNATGMFFFVIKKCHIQIFSYDRTLICQ